MSFTSIHDATPEQWERIYRAQDAHHRGREYRWVLRLLRAGRLVRDGFGVDQLSHGLQVASRAERAGADDELVLVGLLHDATKPLSLTRHGEIAAEMWHDYFRPGALAVLKWHGVFLADVVHGTDHRSRFRSQAWFSDAVRFARWDAASFDPHYPTHPLSHFMPRLMRLYRLGGPAGTTAE